MHSKGHIWSVPPVFFLGYRRQELFHKCIVHQDYPPCCRRDNNIKFFLTELSETMMGDEDHPHQRSRSPPPHHLLPPPPPPPPTVTSGTNHHGAELRHFVGRDFSTPPSHHAHHLHHGHHQTSLSMLNRSSSPAHDLGYHTLVARGSTPASAAPCWSPTDHLADLTLTPSPR